MTQPCPNCGFHHRSDGFAAGLSRIGLTLNERSLLERLVRAGGAPVTRDRLIDAVYGRDPEGGPLSADMNIYVYIRQLNRKLSKRGFRVKLEGYGLGWSLEDIQP